MRPESTLVTPEVAERERSGPLTRLTPDLARRLVPLYLAVPVLGLWLFLTPNSGGYFPRDWYPAAVLAVAVALVIGVATGRALPQARGARVALLLLAGFVAWAYASLLWAESTGAAWESANKLLVLLALSWALALLPWGPDSARWLMGAWALGVAAFAVVSLAGASGTDELSRYLFEYRYQHPIGYANGNAALGFVAALAAFSLSNHRDGSPVMSGVFLAAAALLADFALLSQSRASFMGMGVALFVLFAVSPDRLRLGARLLLLAGAVALAIGPIFDVNDAGQTERALAPALDDAVAAIWPSVVVAGVAGLLTGLAERFGGRRESIRVAGRRAGIAGAVVVALAAAALVVVSLDRISDTVDEQWSTLTGEEYESSEGARISNLDPYERPDYWRVSIDLFEESPVTGAGTGNFEREYTARRDEPKHSRFAHNMFMRALGEGGAVAAALLVGYFLSVFVAGLMLRRRSEQPASLVLGAGLAMTAYFVAHLNFDWLEEIPALASPALALPLVALVAAAAPAPLRSPAPDSRLRRAGGWPVAAVAVVAIVSLVPPYLAVRYENRAEERAIAGDREGAFEDLDRARSLNPAAMEPDLAEGRIALEAGRYARARTAYERSLTVEDNWLAHFELALLDAGEGRFARARANLREARELNALDPVLTRLRESIQARRRVDPQRENERIRDDARARFTTSGR
jgi:O-antigen ligase